MTDQELAQNILREIGGEENVNSLMHCVTRLRFKLKDTSVANDEAIKNLDGVMTVVQSGGQYQVVIGDNVTDIYDEVLAQSHINQGTTEEVAETTGKENIGTKLVNLLSGLFTPILGALAAAGILKGFLVLLTTLHVLQPTDGTYVILNAAADALFFFLPAVLGFSAARVFKTDEFVSAIIGLSLVYPTIVDAFNKGTHLTFLHIPVVMMNYTSSLVPIVVSIFALSYVERFLKKFVPKALKLIFVPVLSIVIMVPLTFLVVGPVSVGLSNALAAAAMWLYGLSPIVAGFLLAGVWQGAVLLGLHWAFIPIFLNNISVQGFDPINAMLYSTVFAQTGAALAVAVKSKRSKDKELAYSATLSGFLGITEPIIYGVTLPKKTPFIAGSIAAAFSGAIAGGFSAKMFGGFASGGVFGIPMFINPDKGVNSSFIGFVISLVVALVLAFIFTWIAYKDKTVEITEPEVATDANAQNAVVAAMIANHDDNVIHAALDGEVLPLSAVPDPVFSSGTMGQGAAIKPVTSTVYAPVSGKVTLLFKTKHAIGLTADNGTEVLIHMGMDTVALNGEGFTPLVAEGDYVKAGQPIMNFDREFIIGQGYDLTTPILVTNLAENQTIKVTDKKQIAPGEDLFIIE